MQSIMGMLLCTVIVLGNTIVGSCQIDKKSTKNVNRNVNQKILASSILVMSQMNIYENNTPIYTLIKREDKEPLILTERKKIKVHSFKKLTYNGVEYVLQK